MQLRWHDPSPYPAMVPFLLSGTNKTCQLHWRQFSSAIKIKIKLSFKNPVHEMPPTLMHPRVMHHERWTFSKREACRPPTASKTHMRSLPHLVAQLLQRLGWKDRTSWVLNGRFSFLIHTGTLEVGSCIPAVPGSL